MHLKISHNTRYTYSSAVFLEPHYLYLYPSHRTYFKTLDYSLSISPDPSGKSLKQDPENNIYKQCWFEDMLQELEIHLELEVSTEAFNPFEFFVEKWPVEEYPVLRPYLEVREKLGQQLFDWSHSFGIDPKEDPLRYLDQICRETNRDWNHEIRYQNNLLEPSQCFKDKAGSCRDLSWMLISILRTHGIPARFVSGYAHNPELLEGHELHAWLEAWLPGAGWIGLDPSAGLFTDHAYIPLCSSYDPAKTLPVQGTFRGEANSSLEANVIIRELDQ